MFTSNKLALSKEFILFLKSFVTSLLISSLTLSFTFSIILFTFILFVTFHATSKKQIFWTKIVSKFISSKLSRLSLSIFKFLRNASISFFTFSTTRFYMTMNDLFVMFAKKSKFLNLSYRQKHTFFQYHWRLDKSFISRQTQITSYFLSSFNSFKFNILSKSNFCLFIQTNVFRRIFFCEQNINFVSRKSFFNYFYCFFHICRRCKQIFEFRNQFHEHFRYCKKSFKHQIVDWNVIVVWKKL